MFRPPNVPVKMLHSILGARRTFGSVVLALVVSAPARAQDGGLSDAGWVDPLYAGCPVAPPPEQLAEGAWKLSPARASRLACLLVTCNDRRRGLESAAPVLSGASQVFGWALFAIGLIGGVYFGWELRGLFR